MEGKKDICCIGHITLDKIITPKLEKYMPGGTSYYFAEGLRHFENVDYQLVTAVGPDEMHVVDDLRKKNINVKTVPSASSVFFVNKYGEDQNHRTQRVLAKAAQFTVNDLQDIDAKIYHLGSLLADDFAPDVIPYLHEKGLVSLDVQGLLREVRGEQVFAVDWKEKRQLLPYVDILKVNEYEMEMLTGCADAHDAALKLAEWGCREVCITNGSYGSVIYAEGNFYEIMAYPPRRIVDVTGCGDTYSTGYLYQRLKGAGYEEAGRFAAAMSTLKLESAGPFSGLKSDILQLVRQYEKAI